MSRVIVPLLTCLLSLALAYPSHAQTAPAIAWQKCLGGSGMDEASSIIQTTDGGLAVAGSTESTDGDVKGNHGNIDAWIVKLSSSGAIEWQKCLGGSGIDRASSIIQTSDGGIVVAGNTESSDGDVRGNHGARYVWIVKLSSAGAIQWQRCLGGTSDDQASSIIETTDGD